MTLSVSIKNLQFEYHQLKLMSIIDNDCNYKLNELPFTISLPRGTAPVALWLLCLCRNAQSPGQAGQTMTAVHTVEWVAARPEVAAPLHRQNRICVQTFCNAVDDSLRGGKYLNLFLNL